VYEFKQNDYFGELALLKDEPRAANILTVVSASFQNL
jgi:CRP-like cAMP-binding protein